ncbi:MAG TPA: hypothetical protein VGJ37_15330 [Pyrinomonadaceae bacterium]
MSEDLTRKLPHSDSEKLTLVLSTVQAVAVRVDNLEQTVKLRLYDTRPVLQKLITDVAQLQEGQRRLEEGQGRLEEGQESLRSELKALRRDVNHRFLVLSGTVLTANRKLEERVTSLELNLNPPNSQT